MPSAELPVTFHFDHFLTISGWERDVRMVCQGGKVEALSAGTARRTADVRLGVGLPGMPNLHSHAFQRGMAGLAEVSGPAGDSFWTWREVMYRFVGRIEPDQLADIAALAYVEMLESGFTRVGEFHYLHRDRDGQPYSNPAEMSLAVIDAAGRAGIALTHLPVFYAHSGFGGAAPKENQKRFVHSLDGFARLHDLLQDAVLVLPDAILGLAPHSLRAVTPNELRELQRLGDNAPIHIHIAEQIREVEDCLAWSGARPVEWLLADVPVGSNWCLVHATHVSGTEIASIANAGAVVGLCPITEANLGDGIFPARSFIEQGGSYGIGTDSNVLIDLTEELRLLEYGQRLNARSRNVLAARAGQSTGLDLFRAALAGGSSALGAPAALTRGAPADFITLDLAHPSLLSRGSERMLDALIFGAGRSAIDGVWRRGEQLVTGGRHRDRNEIVRRYQRSLEALIS